MTVKKQTPAEEKPAKTARTGKPAYRTGRYYHAVGRRKSAIANVSLYKGKGDFRVNEFSLAEYFPYQLWQETAKAALLETSLSESFDAQVIVYGGGKRGQSEAVRLGVARALLVFDPDLRKVIKAKGYLTRDPRVKERKKPGLKRARRAPQWSKR